LAAKTDGTMLFRKPKQRPHFSFWKSIQALADSIVDRAF
jgi:hypothetical protein